jgi:hypothetical protein
MLATFLSVGSDVSNHCCRTAALLLLLSRLCLLLAASTCCVQTRVLRLQVAELERSIHALNTAMPDLPAIDRDIAALKADLLKVGAVRGAVHEVVTDCTLRAVTRGPVPSCVWLS